MKVVAWGVIAIGLAILGWWAIGNQTGPQALLVEGAVARPLHGGNGVAVTLTLTNSGTPDRLIGVSGADGDASLYGLVADALPVPTGVSSLALDGAHMRIAGAIPEEGTLLPITLTFEDAGAVPVKARFQAKATQGHEKHAGMGAPMVEAEAPAPTITLAVSPEGDRWKIEAATEHFTFSEELMDGDHVPGTGHGHLYVGGIKIGRMLSPVAYVGALPPGAHKVRVTLNSNDHRALAIAGVPVSGVATILVDE